MRGFIKRNYSNIEQHADNVYYDTPMKCSPRIANLAPIQNENPKRTYHNPPDLRTGAKKSVKTLSTTIFLTTIFNQNTTLPQ